MSKEWLNQPLCDTCWKDAYGDRQPVRVRFPEHQFCSNCESGTFSGIFVRRHRSQVNYVTDWDDAEAERDRLHRSIEILHGLVSQDAFALPSLPDVGGRPEAFYVVDSLTGDAWNVKTGAASNWFRDQTRQS